MTVRCAAIAAIAAGIVGLALSAAPTAGGQPAPEDDIRDYPVAQGRYTTPDDLYFVYFKTPDGRSCGIGPNGGPVGCDAVPADAPPGTLEAVSTVIEQLAGYKASLTNTRNRLAEARAEDNAEAGTDTLSTSGSLGA